MNEKKLNFSNLLESNKKTADILKMDTSNNHRQNSNTQSVYYPKADLSCFINYSEDIKNNVTKFCMI